MLFKSIKEVINYKNLDKLIIAYEPVLFAIGTESASLEHISAITSSENIYIIALITIYQSCMVVLLIEKAYNRNIKPKNS